MAERPAKPFHPVARKNTRAGLTAVLARHMRTKCINLFLVAAACFSAGRASRAQEPVSIEPEVLQSKERIAVPWNSIDEDRRDAIHRYLLGLGLSSTGRIQLIDVYRVDASRSLFHFQQLDLHGSRLFWSVLVDAESMSGKLVYHIQHDRISDRFMPIPGEPGSDGRAGIR